MTDAGGPNRNKKIKILENIVMKIRDKDNRGNDLMCRKNEKNVMNSIKRRDTISSCFFDEEPVFSNSDEESSYCENILTSLKIPNSVNNMQKVYSAEDQHNLSPDELKVIKLAKECTSINTDNVNDDFKHLINVCNHLQSKYGTPLTSEAPKNRGNNSHFDGNEISKMRNSVCSPNLLTPVSSPQKLYEEVILPSKNGDTTGASTSFFQQFFSFDDPSNGSPITKSSDTDESKVLRRSSRTPKPVQRRENGVFIIGKDRNKYLNKRKGKAKTQNKVIKHKTLSRKSSSKAKNTRIGRKLTNSMNVNKENNTNLVKLNNKVETNKYGSISLEHRKPRRIYSPKEWMESDEFKNLCLIERRNFSL